MKKNTILIIAVVVLVAGLLLWRGNGASDTDQIATLATGITSVNFADSIPLYDFGSVSMLKGNVEHNFTIKNTTNEDIILQGAETSCMCTRAVLVLPNSKEIGPFGMPGHGFAPQLNETMRPGEAVAVRVIFDPAAHGPAGIGTIERVVTLTTNKGPITMQFRAQVTP